MVTPQVLAPSPFPGAEGLVSEEKVRVAIICQHLTMGGAEELVLGIATHLPRDRYDVRVVCLTREGIIARELREQRVRVDLLSGEPGPRDPRAFARLIGYLRDWKPHIAHTFLLNAVLYGRLAAIVAGVPAIFAAEQNVYQHKAARHALMERALSWRTDAVIACCQAVGDFYRRQVGIAPGKLAVILNAVRYDQFLPLPDRYASRAALGLDPAAPTIGVIGRLTRQKGHDVLIHAVQRLVSDHPSLQVAIAGQGEDRSKLESLAESLGVRGHVHFLGVRRDREHLYGSLDVFVLPSRWEGLSLALAEAVGAGIPTVATDVGGNREVIQSGSTGILVSPEHTDALADAIHRLLSDAELRRTVSERAVAQVRPTFEIGRYVKQLDRLYSDSLRRQR